jgi:hypothetical protein
VPGAARGWLGRMTDPEVEALLACARAAADARQMALLAEDLSAGPTLDWTRFVQQADAHRLTCLLAPVLGGLPSLAIPAQTAMSLQDLARIRGTQARLLTAELKTLLPAFEARSIPVIPYKGPVLTGLLYGSPTLRDFDDIDVLVRPGDVTAARAALSGAGFHRRLPRMSSRREQGYLASRHAETWHSEDRLVTVDLHWRLIPAPHPFEVDPERLWAGLISTSFEGLRVAVFPPETLLVALCLHGAKDRWYRLVWLCDLDRVVRTRGLSWARVLDLARSFRCERALALGLFLVRELLRSPLPDEISRRVDLTPQVVGVARDVYATLATGEIRFPLLDECLGLETPLRLGDTPVDRAGYLWRTLTTVDEWDWYRFRLPESLYPLYKLLRPVRLLARSVKRSLRRLARALRVRRFS